ncbi:MAG TPA: TylF/MycF/NovP-related O-methyltransferase [Candidatus Methylomirabilis sp.]|nr:TylF/MycF/NovP-related O-methyltransferase [Candidatus Methylomirabilis sp.]
MQSKTHIRALYDSLPLPLKTIARAIARIRDRNPFSARAGRERWISEVYTQFGLDKRREIFLSIARFCHINRPIDGYYFEFGCHEGNTFRMAYDNFHHLFDWTYVACDSFEGLPEIEEVDKQEIWKRGKLKTSEEDFIRLVTRHGVPKDRLITVKGYYDQSLTTELKSTLLPKKAAVVYVDCDLYTSTVPVLNFIRDFLQRGTIIVFDDWNCFHGDPEKGERRAFAEFRAREPRLVFEDFVETNESKAFICLGERASVRE